jgi:membrane protease YdiL (CAAX protease family)
VFARLPRGSGGTIVEWTVRVPDRWSLVNPDDAMPRPTARRPATSPLFLLLPLAAVPVVALLRSFHPAMPRVPGLPAPFDSPLFWLTALLVGVHLVDRRRDQDLFTGGRDRGLTLAMVVPVLIAVVAEKWFAVDVLANAYGWIDRFVADLWAADALYRMWSGLALLAISLLLLVPLRQVRGRIARTLEPRRAGTAAWIVPGAALLTALLVAVLPALLTGAPLRLPPLGWSLLGLVALAQIVRGAAEELFFRGLLQTDLIRVMVQAGLPEHRLARLGGIGVVSVGFTLEHLGGGPVDSGMLRALVWTFAMSVLLGLLLEVSRNLYLVMASHTVVNLIIAGLLPVPVGPTGAPLFGARTPALIFLVTVFLAVFVLQQRQRHRREAEAA